MQNSNNSLKNIDLLSKIWDHLGESTIIVPVTTKDDKKMDKIFIERDDDGTKTFLCSFITEEDAFAYGDYIKKEYNLEIAFTKLNLESIIKTIKAINKEEVIINNCYLVATGNDGKQYTLDSLWSENYI